MSGRDAYLDTVAAEWPEVTIGNLDFYLRRLFAGVSLPGTRVLDIGSGDGLYTLFAAAAGADEVVALEPEATGSASGMRERFERAARRLGVPGVQLRAQTFQEYDPGEDRFDVVLSHASINHLDESACEALAREQWARDVYAEQFARLAAMTAPGGRLIVVDASRRNLFAKLPVRNPLAPTIEWEKHQPPAVWIELLSRAGFERPAVEWLSLNTLRTPGRLLLGNRVAAWLLQSAFRLTMTRAAPPA